MWSYDKTSYRVLKRGPGVLGNVVANPMKSSQQAETDVNIDAWFILCFNEKSRPEIILWANNVWCAAMLMYKNLQGPKRKSVLIRVVITLEVIFERIIQNDSIRCEIALGLMPEKLANNKSEGNRTGERYVYRENESCQ